MMKSGKNKRLIIFIILLAIGIWFSNPNWIPFISDKAKIEIKNNISTFFSNEYKGFGLSESKFITLICFLAVVGMVYIILKNSLERVLKHNPTKRQMTMFTLTNSLLKYSTALIAIFFGLAIMGINTSAIFATVGIVTLVVGFGAENLIADVITGLFIIFEGQYDIGDYIIIGNFRGKVESIGIRTTTLCDAMGNRKIMNNSDIRDFQNCSVNPSLAISEVGISYDTDLKKLDELLSKELPKIYQKHHDIFLAQPQFLGIQSFESISIMLRFAVSVKEENIYQCQRVLNREIKDLFDQYNIEIPIVPVVVSDSVEDLK